MQENGKLLGESCKGVGASPRPGERHGARLGTVCANVGTGADAMFGQHGFGTELYCLCYAVRLHWLRGDVYVAWSVEFFFLP